jgi:Bacterial PH domain
MPDVFAIAPASTKPLWFLGAIGVLLLGLLLLFAFFGYSSRATRFVLSSEGLAIRGTLYGRTVPWSRLEVDQARVVDLREERELRPTLRTNGLGLPGYRAGWFRLPNRGRGLLFVTDPSRVVAIPTREGYTLLLSVAEADAFVEALRREAPGHPA